LRAPWPRPAECSQTGLGNPNKFSVHHCGEGLFQTVREGGPRNFGNLKGLLDYAVPEDAERSLELLAGCVPRVFWPCACWPWAPCVG